MGLNFLKRPERPPKNIKVEKFERKPLAFCQVRDRPFRWKETYPLGIGDGAYRIDDIQAELGEGDAGYAHGIVIFPQTHRAEVRHFAVSVSMQGTGLSDLLLAFLANGLQQHHGVQTIRFLVAHPRPGHPRFFARIGAIPLEGGEWKLRIGGPGT